MRRHAFAATASLPPPAEKVPVVSPVIKRGRVLSSTAASPALGEKRAQWVAGGAATKTFREDNKASSRGSVHTAHHTADHSALIMGTLVRRHRSVDKAQGRHRHHNVELKAPLAGDDLTCSSSHACQPVF